MARSPKKFSRNSDYLDKHIKQTTYSLGYENEVTPDSEPQSQPSPAREELEGRPTSDVELAMENLGVKFESENDLLEHYKMSPKEEHEDLKAYDPFASDESEAESPSQRSFGDEHGIQYETDDAYKMNSEDEAESGKEAGSYVDFEDEIIQYDI